MHILSDAPAWRARLTETRIRFDADGDRYVDTGEDSGRTEGTTRVTHYEGGPFGDLFQLDAPDPMSCADLADHIAACQALLDEVDPTRVNRWRGPVAIVEPTCLPSLYAATERRAREVAQRYTLDVVKAFIAAADGFRADRAELAAYSRAEHILSGVLHGPVNLEPHERRAHDLHEAARVLREAFADEVDDVVDQLDVEQTRDALRQAEFIGDAGRAAVLTAALAVHDERATERAVEGVA